MQSIEIVLRAPGLICAGGAVRTIGCSSRAPREVRITFVKRIRMFSDVSRQALIRS